MREREREKEGNYEGIDFCTSKNKNDEKFQMQHLSTTSIK